MSIRLFKQDSISNLINNSHLLNKYYENAFGGLTKSRNRLKQILFQIIHVCVCVCVFYFTVYIGVYVVYSSRCGSILLS